MTFRKLKKARDTDSIDEAYAYAMRLLEFRFRGEAELRSKLAEKGFTNSVAESVVERLRGYKYIDDVRLLESLIRGYKDHGLYGPLYIKQKLLGRTFSREQIDTALKHAYPAIDEIDVARQYFAKQKIVLTGDQKEKNRHMQRFLRRGFSPDVVFKLFKQENNQ